MKTIVIAGAGSKTGKTTVALFLESLLPHSYVVKLGVRTERQENRIPLFPVDADFSDISDTIPPDTEYLIIESGRIAKKIKPDCLIYMDLPEDVPTEDDGRAHGLEDPQRARKESTLWLLDTADLVSGKKVSCQKAWEIADRLAIQKILMGKILDFLKIKVKGCQLGLF